MQRALVETRDGPYGSRLVERLGAVAPEQSVGAPEVEFTVDPVLEEKVRGVLARGGVAHGHVVAMDAQSGEIFAYVSKDPTRFPATRVYPTASLMKIITAAAVLERVPAATRRPCRSFGSPYELREAHLDPEHALDGAPPPGSVGATTAAGGGGHARDGVETAPAVWVGSFRRALAISNNQCFARLAVHDLGEAALVEEIRRAGLLEPPAAEHPGGSLDPIETRLDLGNLGSGLAGSAITPLAAVRLAGLLAEGRLVEPRWIARRWNAENRAPIAVAPGAGRRVWEREIADTLREHLRSVTESGTARRAFQRDDGSPRLGPVAVAGKTGTLRGTDPEGLYQWFIGVAPAEAPTLALAVLVLHPDGAERAASASEIAAATFEEMVCDSGRDCRTARLEPLRARVAARSADTARQQATLVAERAAAAAARAERNALDAPLRPAAGTRVELPRRLRRRHWDGEVVLRVEVGPDGAVLAAAVDSSDLPRAFGRFLVAEARGWRFNPPRRNGRPVNATARLPIPIRVE